MLRSLIRFESCFPKVGARRLKPRPDLVNPGVRDFLRTAAGLRAVGSGAFSPPMKPQPGQSAPLFTAPVSGEGYGEDATVSLEDLRGRRVVLVFYPKDDTPGCTKQACALRDGWDELAAKARVFGVSVDPLKSHRRFIAKHGLPYPLIADEDQAIVSAYGVWVEKSMYGKKYMGTERSSFVIGADGTIEAVLEKVAPDEHLPRLLAALG
jgi:peroxiredoxin Q/BCP